MDKTTVKDLLHVVVLLGLIAILVFLLTWTGIMKCRVIPGWCGVYWSIVGPPRILIVEGDYGLGNPELLQQTLADPTHAGVFSSIQHIERVSLGNLQEFDLVIVERARRISSEKLRIFMDYVNTGGRLVWTGDAGVEAENPNEYLYADEDPEQDTNEHVRIGPWARKFGNDVLAFHEFLGVQFQTNYCEVKDCQGLPWQGVLVTNPGRNHPLVLGLRPNLVLRGDFAIVEDAPAISSTRILTLDWYSDLIGQDQFNYGRHFPLIVTSGYGERVAYYAVPPEQFVEDFQPDKYYSIIENVYYGMLR